MPKTDCLFINNIYIYILKKKKKIQLVIVIVGCSAQQVGWPVAHRQTGNEPETGKTKWLADHVKPN